MKSVSVPILSPLIMLKKLRALLKVWHRDSHGKKMQNSTLSEESMHSVLTIQEQPDVQALNNQNYTDMPYDEHLYERARTQWQFGDWESLTKLDAATVEHHPEGAKLALLAAAGHMQTNNFVLSRQFVQLSKKLGCNKRLISQILISNVHNSLACAAALSGRSKKAKFHFEAAISIGSPRSDQSLLVQARMNEQYSRIHLLTLSSSSQQNSISSTEKSKLVSNIESFDSARYWNGRYEEAGNSGYGSYGRLAEFKAEQINWFIDQHSIKNIVDLGCGDGHQLSMLKVDKYVGVDVSPIIINKCKLKFENDKSKSFFNYEDFKRAYLKADLTISLDVIFHLIEDDVFEDYMRLLFESSNMYCIIYSCDENKLITDPVHVRRREFTKWIGENLREWRLAQVIYNKFPHDGSRNPKDLSFSDFYFYEKTIH